MKTVFSFKFKKVDEENKVSDSKQSFTNSVQINKQNNNNIKEKKKTRVFSLKLSAGHSHDL